MFTKPTCSSTVRSINAGKLILTKYSQTIWQIIFFSIQLGTFHTDGHAHESVVYNPTSFWLCTIAALSLTK